jgi:hypothetical protein
MTSPRWETLRLHGHGTSIAVPAGWFVAQPEPGSEEHRLSARHSCGAEICLWNEIKPKGRTVESLLKHAAVPVEMVTRSEVSHEAVKVEGYDADWFVHRRIRLSKSGRLHGVDMRFPAALKAELDHIAAEVCASLSGD